MFDSFVSLGYCCGTASSMSQYGLRSFSGPFDWLVASNFRWILHYMETDFTDYIRRDQLESHMGFEKKFIDKVSGFIFLHEQEDYRNQYELLKEKYDRRIQKFLRASCKGACFLRYVVGREELDYIKNNAEYVRRVIGRHNRQNEIVLLVKKGVQIPEGMPFKVFQATGELSTKTKYAMRAWFDGMTEFLEYCGRNYPGNELMKNLIFDKEGEQQESRRMDRRYQTLAAMSVHDFSQTELPPELMIYGTGKLGQVLYDRLRHYTKIKCFVDRSRGGTKLGDIPIYSIDDLDRRTNGFMIVSTTYDFESIRETIHKRCKEIQVISLDQIIEKKG